ncbi:alpha-glucan family phosphorylase [Mucilaginibacter endophyticus]|uniref:alpha-glucan family phosphorylase n=1 Tax=Mucilaginibacter endophyticus TaxID=2675003 RepID=UPI000E0CEDD1|nr:alpha-glucan family phosphorylase [Mucilaginibacter endophyticus]
MITKDEIFGYTPDKKYQTSVAYFSMEFAVDQALKIYSGGLGFLSGSHLRSAYQLKQNLIGIGILWKYGYYDQARDSEGLMKAEFIRKEYAFLKDLGFVFQVSVHDAPVHVKAYLLPPETFGTAPLILLSTDIDENDELSRSITHCLYDPNEATRIAQSIILGIGGATLLDLLGLEPDIYHMNEGHSVPLNFYLLDKFKSLAELKKRVVFTTHTPEMAGNESHSYVLLKEMSFFYHLQDTEVRKMLGMQSDRFNYTLGALKFSRKANGVSKLHGEVARQMWGKSPDICEITSITNAQNNAYWSDTDLNAAFADNDDGHVIAWKKEMKRSLFKIVADQCGKLFDENVLTIVWARRFAGYKRAGLIMKDWGRFTRLLEQTDYPIQLIWAGKPYPEDNDSIDQFNQIMIKTRPFKRCAVLTGYELALSAMLKKGSDVWLNNPKLYHEASGTSGMTAAMNGSINLSMPDGWVPEFAREMDNCFLIRPAPGTISEEEKDILENRNLMDLLENVIMPMYYRNQDQWLSIMKQAAKDIFPVFESARMADEYYMKMYSS